MMNMPAAKTSFKRWYRQTGNPVPLRFVPHALNVSPAEVVQAVKTGRLRVFTFTAENGTTYRLVPWEDIQRYGRNPLTERTLHVAFRRLLAA